MGSDRGQPMTAKYRHEPRESAESPLHVTVVQGPRHGVLTHPPTVAKTALSPAFPSTTSAMLERTAKRPPTTPEAMETDTFAPTRSLIRMQLSAPTALTVTCPRRLEAVTNRPSQKSDSSKVSGPAPESMHRSECSSLGQCYRSISDCHQ
jgi:hypothetical protein